MKVGDKVIYNSRKAQVISIYNDDKLTPILIKYDNSKSTQWVSEFCLKHRENNYDLIQEKLESLGCENVEVIGNVYSGPKLKFTYEIRAKITNIDKLIGSDHLLDCSTYRGCDKPKKAPYKKGAEYLTSEAVPDDNRDVCVVIDNLSVIFFYYNEKKQWFIRRAKDDLSGLDWVPSVAPKKWKEL